VFGILIHMIVVIPFTFGLLFGSFLNVLIDRLPIGKDVMRGRSHCDYCNRTLFWYELIPLLSWIIQAGKSRCCKKSLSVQYPFVELVTGIVFAQLFTIFFPTPLLFVAFCCIAMAVIVLIGTDVKFELLPTPLLYLWGVGIMLRFFALHISMGDLLYTYIIPSACAGLFFFVLWFVSKGKAMGDGDIWLAILIGLVTGYPGIIISLYVAFLTGAAMGVILILGRLKTLKSHIPFGPFLLLGMVIEQLYGMGIYTWWLKLWA
jgi:prepilin signal peptidase PulO-like enzyme (type II secretory pathway)